MSESTGTMMAESGMPANPYQYWTRNRAYDVLAAVHKRVGGMGGNWRDRTATAFECQKMPAVST